MTATADSIALAGVAARAAAEKLGEDILVLDVSDRLAITDAVSYTHLTLPTNREV